MGPDSNVEDDEWVVRGGLSPNDRLIINAQSHEADNPGEWAVSGAASKGREPPDIAALCPWIKNTELRVAYAGEIREAGFDVYCDGRPHVNVVFPSDPEASPELMDRFRGVFWRPFSNPNA